MAKTATISVRVPANVKKAAEMAAKDDGRSLAAMVERIVTAWLRDNNYLQK
jgi:predicted HicB family RNase H-like nuclease